MDSGEVNYCLLTLVCCALPKLAVHHFSTGTMAMCMVPVTELKIKNQSSIIFLSKL
jgi:hypothetical protein